MNAMKSNRTMSAVWRWGRLGAASLLLLSAAATASAQAPRFDGRGWAVGHQQSNDEQSLTEYVLPGQTVENWRELVTSQVFFQPVPLARLLEKSHAAAAQGCPSLVWNVIQQDEKTAIYEWRDSGCGGFEPQHELARVTIERDGLYRLAYAAKMKRPLPADRRNQWLAILGQVPLAEGAVRGSAPERRPAPAASGNTGLAPKETTEALAAGVQRSGWPCPGGSKSELRGLTQGPQGPLRLWLVECSNGAQYSVMVDPSGAITAFPRPK